MAVATFAEKLPDRKSKRTRQRKTREEIGKENKMTTLRFQTGGFNIRHPWPFFGGTVEVYSGQYKFEQTMLTDQRLSVATRQNSSEQTIYITQSAYPGQLPTVLKYLLFKGGI